MFCLQLACEAQAPYKVGIVPFFISEINGFQMAGEQKAMLSYRLEHLKGGNYAKSAIIAPGIGNRIQVGS